MKPASITVAAHDKRAGLDPFCQRCKRTSLTEGSVSQAGELE